MPHILILDLNNALEAAIIAAEQAEESTTELTDLKANCNDAYEYCQTHGEEVNQEDKKAYRLHNQLDVVQTDYVDNGPMGVGQSINRANDLNPNFDAERPFI